MEWIPPLYGIAMCQNGDVSPSTEEGIQDLSQSLKPARFDHLLRSNWGKF
jgi:hypothetical protein